MKLYAAIKKLFCKHDYPFSSPELGRDENGRVKYRKCPKCEKVKALEYYRPSRWANYQD